MKVFSLIDYITFLPWKKESLTILGNSGILRKFWAQMLLQCISPPALNKITTASRNSNDVDLVLADLQEHYADPHVAISTLAQCHRAVGPIPDPEVYKESALPIIRLHSQILAGSAALVAYSDTPGVTTSLYSQQFCLTLVGLLPCRSSH